MLLVLKPPIIKLLLSYQLVPHNKDTIFLKYYAGIEEVHDILEVYLWNVTNADQFTSKINTRGRIQHTFPLAHVEQVGPFKYKQNYIKENFTYYDENRNFMNDSSWLKKSKYVRFRQKFVYTSLYDPEDTTSGLNPDTTIVNIANILGLAIPKVVEFICGGFNTRYFPQGCSSVVFTFLRRIANRALIASEEGPLKKSQTATQAIWGGPQKILQYIAFECVHFAACRESGFLKVFPTDFGGLYVKGRGFEAKFGAANEISDGLKFPTKNLCLI